MDNLKRLSIYYKLRDIKSNNNFATITFNDSDNVLYKCQIVKICEGKSSVNVTGFRKVGQYIDKYTEWIKFRKIKDVMVVTNNQVMNGNSNKR